KSAWAAEVYVPGSQGGIMPGLAGKGWRKRSYALKTLFVRFLENTNFIDILSGFVYKSAVIVVSPDFSFRERSARQKFGSETLRLWAFFFRRTLRRQRRA